MPQAGDRERYVSVLLAEAELATSAHEWASGPATTVYFGGGTPSLHPPTEIAGLLAELDRKWGIANAAEITLEANPEDVQSEIVREWKRAGINRLSLGIQSFSDRKLKILARKHSPSGALAAVRLAREAGFKNVSLDLIFGLPDETLEEWTRDIETALRFEPEHLSLYALEIHEGTPFHRWEESGRLVPLADDQQAELYLHAHDLLAGHGVEHYEVSNYARPGFRAVHNSAYWQGKPYLGLGASAHSFDGENLRFHNTADIAAYVCAIGEGRLPIENRTQQSERDRIEEWISLSLRRVEGIAWNDALAKFGQEGAEHLWRRASDLPAHLRNLSPERLSLTPEGWLRENSVLLWLYEKLGTAEDHLAR